MKELGYTITDLIKAIIKLIGMALYLITMPIAYINVGLGDLIFTKSRQKRETKKQEQHAKKGKTVKKSMDYELTDMNKRDKKLVKLIKKGTI